MSDRPTIEQLFGGRGLRSVFHAIYDISTEPRIYAHEALMRGPRGMPFEGPMLAFAMAKSVDVLEELDLKCIEAALSAESPGDRIFVNLHPTTATGISAERIVELVERGGRAPSNIVLEIIEHGPDNDSELIAAIARLRDAGFGIAIDDFGEGSSNLRRVVRVRPDYIKIDRWFAKGSEYRSDLRAVLRATGMLGQDLGIRVIAEGIQNTEQIDVMREAQIPLIQCYDFTPPGLEPRPVHQRAAHENGPDTLDPARPDSMVLSQIDDLGERELDQLPFGVIQLAPDGTILQYNRYEEDLARSRASDVIGKNFFRDVAPCTDVREFAGKFREGVQRGRLHATFDYVFTFDPPRKVRVTLYLSVNTNTVWVFVQE